MSFIDFLRGIRPALVSDAFKSIERMLELGEQMFVASTGRLWDNEVIDLNLKEMDDEIDLCEQRLRRSVLEHLTLDPNRELVFSLKLLTIVGEAERIGDNAKAISKLADLAHAPRMGDHLEPIRDVRNRILSSFERIKSGFIGGDQREAEELMRGHEKLKKDIAALIKEIANMPGLTPNEAVVLAMGIRMMSRVNSHLANIASTVVVPFDKLRRAPAWDE